MLHIYQRTESGYNIFYDLEDSLVFYTVFSVISRKYDLKISGLCLMIDHIHGLVMAEDEKVVSAFVSHYTSVFVKLYNEDVGRGGRLFERSYGRACKTGTKKIRTAIAYLLNNPVEKRLCRRAEEYRWNFLAYAVSGYPFSEPKPVRYTSKALRKSMKEVSSSASEGRYLNYVQLRRMYNSLSQSDREVLTDHIISTYNVIDYEMLISYYGSYENLLIAVNSNTGSEYDIKEVYHKGSDTVYHDMISCVRHRLMIQHVRSVTVMDVDSRLSIASSLQRYTSGTLKQICRFLHLKACPVND